jgi:hypothetical protein
LNRGLAIAPHLLALGPAFLAISDASVAVDALNARLLPIANAIPFGAVDALLLPLRGSRLRTFSPCRTLDSLTFSALRALRTLGPLCDAL